LTYINYLNQSVSVGLSIGLSTWNL